MVEPEIAHCTLSQLLEIEEQFVSHIVQTCLRERAAELSLLQRDRSHLENIKPPFARITYDEATTSVHLIPAAHWFKHDILAQPCPILPPNGRACRHS